MATLAGPSSAPAILIHRNASIHFPGAQSQAVQATVLAQTLIFGAYGRGKLTPRGKQQLLQLLHNNDWPHFTGDTMGTVDGP